MTDPAALILFGIRAGFSTVNALTVHELLYEQACYDVTVCQKTGKSQGCGAQRPESFPSDEMVKEGIMMVYTVDRLKPGEENAITIAAVRTSDEAYRLQERLMLEDPEAVYGVAIVTGDLEGGEDEAPLERWQPYYDESLKANHMEWIVDVSE